MRGNTEWINISDLMSGLMMVFLFVAVLFMIDVDAGREDIRQVRSKIHEALYQEFKEDLKKWNAVLLKDNTIRFKSPDVLFDTESSELTSKFENILLDFFPRYVGVLTRDEFVDEVEELRIEGHTDSRWEGAMTTKKRFLNNSKLSQERAHAVLAYCFGNGHQLVRNNEEWLLKVLRANGLAFAMLLDANGNAISSTKKKEDREKSRRVDFKVKTNIESILAEVE